MRWAPKATGVGFWAALVACGPNTAVNQSTPNPPVVPSAQVALSSSGANPETPIIAVGGRLSFLNSDTVPHQVASDSAPQGDTCPELNGPPLAPGERFSLTVVQRSFPCGFHDLLHPDDVSFQGTVIVEP